MAVPFFSIDVSLAEELIGISNTVDLHGCNWPHAANPD
ncbi:hypothetical protein FHW89_003209 [Mucilaginibacter sp. SG564]|nr:hypothetical protein [Mucilaginibacter sp. SG564]